MIKNSFKKTILIVLTIICMVFSSCSERSQNLENMAGSENDLTMRSGLEMSLVSTGGVLNQRIATSLGGSYSILTNADGSGILIYYDYETLQLVYLSNQLIPTKDETNPGWIKNVDGGVTPLVINDKLYVLNFGVAPVPSTKFTGYSACIIQMDLDGSNRKTIECPQYLIQYDSAIAHDGSYIYFMAKKIDEKTGKSDYSVLCKADFNSGVIEEVEKLGDNNTEYNIMGVYDDGLLFYVQIFGDNYYTVDERYSNMDVKYTSFSLFDNSQKDMYQFRNGDINAVVLNEKMYFFEIGSDILKERDLLTGETNEVLSLDEIVGSDINYDDWRLYGNLTDNHLCLVLWSGEDAESFWSCAIDLITHELSELTLTYKDGVMIKPVAVYGENNQYFLVETGKVYFTEQVTIDGNLAEVSRDELMFSLIRKEDYWNSNPEYIEFADNVYTGYENSEIVYSLE